MAERSAIMPSAPLLVWQPYASSRKKIWLKTLTRWAGILARLHREFDNHPHIGDIRGRGLFWGLELVKDRMTTDPFHASRKTAWRVWERAFDLGLAVYYSQGCADGINGDIIMIGPPLIINRSQIDDLVDILAEAIKQELGP